MELTKEIICSKLRACNIEFGYTKLKWAVIIGPEDYESVSDLPYVTAPTLGHTTLCNVPFKIARFFEDFDYHE